MRKVLLITSDEFAWPGVRAMLHAMTDVQVIGEAANAADALEASATLSPDVVIVPPTLERQSSLDLIRTLHERCPDIVILVLGAWYDPEELAALAEAGVRGYLLWTDLDFDTIQHCVYAVIFGDVMIGSVEVSKAFFEAMGGKLYPRALVQLTPRQRAILALLAEDFTDKEIATSLHISANTVGTHIHNICVRLGVRTRFALGLHAQMRGPVQRR